MDVAHAENGLASADVLFKIRYPHFNSQEDFALWRIRDLPLFCQRSQQRLSVLFVFLIPKNESIFQVDVKV